MQPYDFSPLLPYLHRLAAMFYDLDGTLVINNEALAHDAITRAIFNAAAQEYQSKHQIQLSKYDVGCTHRLAGTPLQDIISYYSEKLEVDLPTDEIIQNINEHRKTMPTEDEEVHVLPVFRQLLQFQKSNYVPRAIVTSSEPDRAERYVVRGDLHTCFDDYDQYIFTGHKPKRDPYHDAWLHMMGVHRTYLPRENCIGLEDTPPGIKSCKASEKVAIGHTMAWHVKDKAKLERKLLRAGADYIINEPEEVVPVLLQAISKMPQLEPSLQRSAFGPPSNDKLLQLRIV